MNDEEWSERELEIIEGMIGTMTEKVWWHRERIAVLEKIRDMMKSTAVAKEREECAKVCESMSGTSPWGDTPGRYWTKKCADAIRNRK